MRRDLVYRDEIMDSLVKEYNRKRTNDGLKLAWIEKAVNDVKPAPIDLPDNNVGDMISRQAAINALFDWEMTYDWDDHCREKDPKPEYIVSPSDVIKRLPPAEPKRGKWIKTARWGRVYKCNQCGNFLDFDGVNVGRGDANFCPNCGSYNGGENEI